MRYATREKLGGSEGPLGMRESGDKSGEEAERKEGTSPFRRERWRRSRSSKREGNCSLCSAFTR